MKKEAVVGPFKKIQLDQTECKQLHLMNIWLDKIAFQTESLT